MPTATARQSTPVRSTKSGLRWIGQVGVRILDGLAVEVRKAAELRLDRDARRVGGLDKRGHRLPCLGNRPAVAVDHHRREPGIDANQGLLQGVRLVQQEGHRDLAVLQQGAAHAAQVRDPPMVQPMVGQHGRAEADDDRRALQHGCVEDGLQRVAVPALEVAHGVTTRPGMGEQLRKWDQGHGHSLSAARTGILWAARRRPTP